MAVSANIAALPTEATVAMHPLGAIADGYQRKRAKISHDGNGAMSPVPNQRVFHPDASIVLIGIRGCGKRSLGFIAAATLGRKFVTEDHYFSTVTGMSRQDYLKIHGSQDFHKQDVAVAKRMLEDNMTNCVIECGLGSLTSNVQEYLKQYAFTHPVIHLTRDMESIRKMLKLSDRSVRTLEQADATHRRCSNFEYYNLEDDSLEDSVENGTSDRQAPTYSFKLKKAKVDFSIFVRSVTRQRVDNAVVASPFSLLEFPVDLRLYTHALLLRFSELIKSRFDFGPLEAAGDVIELCVDTWDSSSKSKLSSVTADIRRQLGVPVMISVDRNRSDLKDEVELFILDYALRLGVEYMCVNLDLDDQQIERLLRAKGNTRVIGHCLDQDSPEWQDDVWMSRYARAEKLNCDVVRFLRSAKAHEDNESLSGFLSLIRTRSTGPRIIAYNLGFLGRTSQVYSHTFTAVTHSSIQQCPTRFAATDASPQVTAKALVQSLFASFALDPLHFYILGGSVSFSLSPPMHNAAYQALGLDHTYRTKDITSMEDIDSFVGDPSFGGASIVQPYKVEMVSRLASKSRHAQAIGAVNTLIPLRKAADGSVYPLHEQARQRNRVGQIAGWYGDNTDWIGILTCIDRNLSPRNAIRSTSSGLVIGAGGMARAAVYAMLKLGCRNIFLHNRTKSHAESVAAHLNQSAVSTTDEKSLKTSVRVLPSLKEPWPDHLDSPTIIISCVPHQTRDGKLAANFEMPTQWLHSATGGIVMEMCYRPMNTPLVRQIKQVRETIKTPWVLVDALETLPEQAIAQFELMTGRKAPRGVMKQAIQEAFRERNRDSLAPDTG